MKQFVFYMICMVAPCMLHAQTTAQIDTILEHNNTLRALRAEVEAQTLLSRSQLKLPDPDVDLSYQFGTPNGVPHRTNINVTQQLDWGVLTGRRRKLAESEECLALAAYREARLNIAQEVATTLTQTIYYNQLITELDERLHFAQELQRLYEKKLSEGEINQLEVNKVKICTTVAQAELKRAQSEQQTALLALQKLNGGQPISVTDTLYAEDGLPALATLQEKVLQSHPQVGRAEQAIQQAQWQARLAQSLAWPTLTVGFAGEYVKQNNYSGPSLGISLPLWGNTRVKVRQAKAEVAARQLDMADAKQQLASQVRSDYATAQALGQTATLLRDQLATTNNAHLLRRSLEEGQISLVDYLMEISFYYSARTAYLEAERDAQLALARLRCLLL